MKLKGYVLIESVMAMIVVMICFGIAMAVISNVTSGTRALAKVRAEFRLQELAAASRREQDFIDQSIPSESFRVDKKITQWKDRKNLYELSLTAIAPDGKILAEYHELFRKP